MRHLILFALAIPLFAQTAGTVAVQTIITATAGQVTCTITPSSSLTSADAVCKVGTATVATGNVSPTSAASAVTMQVNVGSDAVTVIITRPTTGPLQWQVAANGTSKQGTF